MTAKKKTSKGNGGINTNAGASTNNGGTVHGISAGGQSERRFETRLQNQGWTQQSQAFREQE